MIRALALASLLTACGYDAILGYRIAPNDASLPNGNVDASDSADAPANFAFDYGGNVGGPLLYDGDGHVFAVSTRIASSVPQRLVRFDTAMFDRFDVGEPVLAMAQDATTIYGLVAGAWPGYQNLVAISKTPFWPPGNGTIDAAAPEFTTTTIATDLAGATATAVDANALYVVANGALVRMTKSGANPTTLVTVAVLSAVAVDDNFAYVVEHTSAGRLLAVPKSGGTALVLADNLVLPLHLDLAAGAIYVTEQGDASTGGAIVRVLAPAAGAHQSDVAPLARIVTGAQTPVDLAHDDTFIYWTADRDGLLRAPLAGGSPEVRMGTALAGNSAVAIQGAYALFVAPSSTGSRDVHAVRR